MSAVRRLATLSLLITAGLGACRRDEPAPSVGPAVPPELRATVGHELQAAERPRPRALVRVESGHLDLNTKGDEVP
jgi:hypothetical protein